MMKNLKFRPVMKILGLRTMDDSNKKILKIGRGTLRRAMLRCERLEDPTKNEL